MSLETDSSDAQSIEYLYLEMDTPLPIPSDIAAPSILNPGPQPECPDLKKYTSPFAWAKSRKSMMTATACSVTALAGYAAGEMGPAAAELTEKWGISNVVYQLNITLFCIGFAAAPMVLAPFSEINGRRPIFIASGILFVASLVGCGGTGSFAGLLVARVFEGIASSTFSTMVGGVISDIYHADDRNTPMSLFAGSALFGTGLSPLISSIIQTRISWRWIYYSHAIAAGIFTVIIYLFFEETRGSVLLSRKARALNKYYEEREKTGYFGVIMSMDEKGESRIIKRIRWRVKSDEERDSLAMMISISVYRPFHMLLTEPVVFFFSLWAAFSWAILYLQFGSITLIFSTNHHFDTEETGAVFAAICVGAILGTVLSICQDILAFRFGTRVRTPETRLHFACVISTLMPAGLFWFGWTSYSSTPWIVPTLAVGCATIGILSIYLAVFNYLADTYHRYASSAIAAQSFCRNMLGGVFPLVTQIMFKNLGYPGASSLLGGIGAALTLVPWVLLFFGTRIRAKSKFASQLSKQLEH